jgi:hypothetical protein
MMVRLSEVVAPLYYRMYRMYHETPNKADTTVQSPYQDPNTLTPNP